MSDLLFLNKYLNINRNRFFDLNTVKKEKAVKSQSKVSKSDSATLSLVKVPWLILQSFDTFFLIESYLLSSVLSNYKYISQSATRFSTVCLSMTFLNYFYLYFINLILFVYHKHILVLLSPTMMANYEFMGT